MVSLQWIRFMTGCKELGHPGMSVTRRMFKIEMILR